MTRVLSTLAMKGVLQATAPGLDVRFDATQALLKSIAEGEKADVVILTVEAIDKLGYPDPLALGSCGVGLAVRAGGKRPDISSLNSFAKAINNAASIAHSKVGASGLYFADLLQRLKLNPKRIIVVERGPVGAVVARGEAELGVQQLCELAPVPGIDIVGPFPGEIQSITRFAAAPMPGAHAQEAQRFLAFLRSPEVRAAMRANLFQPANT